jgi:hypothetical protein
MTLQKIAPNLIATLVSWLTIGLVVAVTEPGAFVRDAVIVIAVLTTAVMWASWGATANAGSQSAAVESEKAKRRAGNDPNVALLLELLSDDERAEIKERLLERVQADGELTSLTELVDEPEAQARRKHLT